MANDKSTDTAFEREDKQMSDGNTNCQRDSDVLIINHLREALAKEFADAEKWSCECQRIEKERDQALAQRDQALHLLSGGTLTESEVEQSGLGVGVLSEQRHHEYMRTKAEAACADWERFAHDVILSRKSDGLWVPTDDLLIDYEKRKSDAGKGWLSPETRKRILEMLRSVLCDIDDCVAVYGAYEDKCIAEEALKLLETE